MPSKRALGHAGAAPSQPHTRRTEGLGNPKPSASERLQLGRGLTIPQGPWVHANPDPFALNVCSLAALCEPRRGMPAECAAG